MRFDAVFFGVVNEEHPLMKADDGAFSVQFTRMF
jgi:hypothetical protein